MTVRPFVTVDVVFMMDHALSR